MFSSRVAQARTETGGGFCCWYFVLNSLAATSFAQRLTQVEGGSRSPSIRLRKNTDSTQASDKLGFVVASISGASGDRRDGAHTHRGFQLGHGTVPFHSRRAFRSGRIRKVPSHSHDWEVK